MLHALVIEITGSWQGEACHAHGPQSCGQPFFDGLEPNNGEWSGIVLSMLVKYQFLSDAIKAGSLWQFGHKLSCQTCSFRKNTRAGVISRH